MPDKRYMIKIILFTGLICVSILISCGVIDEQVPSGFQKISEITESETLGETADHEATRESYADASIYIYVCGAVVRPDVYQMKMGDRQYQAIQAAGGVTEAASTERMNLAEVLRDGERLYVPTALEVQNTPDGQDGMTVTDASEGLVNINTADQERLMTLPGIGETKAKKIIDYRTSMGPFTSKEALKEVSGIGDATYETLKDLITT